VDLTEALPKIANHSADFAMALVTKLFLFIVLVSVVHIAITDDSTYYHFWMSLKSNKKGTSVWNPDPDADTTEAKVVLNKTVVSGVECASECTKLYKKESSTEACTGYNYDGKDILSPGRCILITAFDSTDKDLIKIIEKKNPKWAFYDLGKYSHVYIQRGKQLLLLLNLNNLLHVHV
jgi:hypothetical protein